MGTFDRCTFEGSKVGSPGRRSELGRDGDKRPLETRDKRGGSGESTRKRGGIGDPGEGVVSVARKGLINSDFGSVATKGLASEFLGSVASKGVMRILEGDRGPRGRNERYCGAGGHQFKPERIPRPIKYPYSISITICQAINKRFVFYEIE